MEVMEKIKIAFIHWIDAIMDDKYDPNFNYGIGVVTVGFVVDDNPAAITLALQLFEDEDSRQVITIPKSFILFRADMDLGSMEDILDGTKQMVEEKEASGDSSNDVESDKGFPTNQHEHRNY